MKEMEDLGFARKLSVKEIREYKSPVHSMAHREVARPEKSTPVRNVFNSSSGYKVHCLNECWMKSPDLFNNIFVVILRFRQQSVAVSGDIWTMNDRTGIPEQDQQVHHFLSRDIDTSRLPDTYIKTVLTFGEKPAPAMAKIALGKTNDREESFDAYAVEVLKFTWTIFTVRRAQTLTKEIDDIL